MDEACCPVLPRRINRRTACHMALMILALLLAAAYLPTQASAVTRGLVDGEILVLASSPSKQATHVRELAGQLHARVVRINVRWPEFEPARGRIDQARVAALSTTVDALAKRNVKVILTVVYTPKWASNSSLWRSPPFGMKRGYNQIYAMRTAATDDLGGFAQHLSSTLKGRVFGYECWNEPNMWVYIYPQRKATDGVFAVRLYARMLKAFHAGVRRGDPHAKVIAGATAPLGYNDKYRTSPQRFARSLKRFGAVPYFDAYSHHPYTPGGSRNPGPNGRPNDPSTCVTMYNLTTLLRLFPSKPFYLTEYGYNTRPSLVFGGFTVSQSTQAAYLKLAYSLARRHSQVKMLLWYLLRDYRPPTGPANHGVYSGLRTAGGAKKRSWYAFAGGK